MPHYGKVTLFFNSTQPLPKLANATEHPFPIAQRFPLRSLLGGKTGQNFL
jgi:hypothetical protein